MSEPEGSARPLSIGLYTYSTLPRGSVVHAAALADALVETGHEVSLYALAKPGAAAFFRPLRARFVPVPALAAPAETDRLIAQRIGELAQHLRAQRPAHDVHHAQDCLVANALLSARAESGGALRVVRTVHHVERFESPYLELCQAASIRDADRVLSVSSATQQDVLAAYGVVSTRIENGIDVERFARPDPALVSGLRERLGIPATAQVLLSFGGIEPRKNSLRLLEAFIALRRAHPELIWLVVGGASILDHAAYRARFEQRLAQCVPDIQRAVVRTGVLVEHEIPACYALASAVACPSLSEGWGLCALEALAAGVPLVVSRIAPFTEYLDDACARLVDPEDIAELAAGIAQALRGGDAARLAAGRARVQHFGWRRVAAAHAAFYRRLLGGEHA